MYDLKEESPIQSDHNYRDLPNVVTLSEYKKAAISHIAGYVAQMVVKPTLCSQCCEAVGSITFAAHKFPENERWVDFSNHQRVLSRSAEKLRRDFTKFSLPLMVNFLKVCPLFQLFSNQVKCSESVYFYKSCNHYHSFLQTNVSSIKQVHL